VSIVPTATGERTSARETLERIRKGYAFAPHALDVDNGTEFQTTRNVSAASLMANGKHPR
jgi:hypothetical protein